MTLTSIPTTYAGIHFRSRLEARWAAFFDIAKWEWIYEPVDGTGYIPDFLIKGGTPFFIEIKPAITEDEYRAPVPKIVAGIGNLWGLDTLILGADCVLHGTTAGILIDFLHGPDDWNTSHAHWVYCPRCVSFAITTDSTSGHMRPCGHTANKGGDPTGAKARGAWALAGNLVQWRSLQ